MKYNKHLDMLVGHDSLTGSYSRGFVDYELDERELGARVAIQINDPEQWWWEIYGPQWDDYQFNRNHPRDR